MKKVEVKRNKRKGLIFEFKEINVGNDTARGNYICKHACSYGFKVCTNLPDPRYGLKNSTYRFSDFCGATDFYQNIVPTPGSLEKYYKKLIEEIKKKNL